MSTDRAYVVLCVKNRAGEWEPVLPGRTTLMDAYRVGQTLTDRGFETKLFGDVAGEKYEEELYGPHPDDIRERLANEAN